MRTPPISMRVGAFLACIIILIPVAARAETKAPAPAAAPPSASMAMVVQVGHPVGGNMVASPDGRLLASSNTSQAEVALHTLDGILVRAIPTGMDGACTRIDFSPDGALIAVSGRSAREGGCAVKLYAVDTGAAAGVITIASMTERVEAVFLPDGKRLAACGYGTDGASSFCIIDPRGALLSELRLPAGCNPFDLMLVPGGITAACLLTGARFAVIGIETGTVRIAEDHEVAGRKGRHVALAAGPEGKRLAICANVEGPQAKVSVGMAQQHAYPLSVWSVDGTLIRRLREERSETDGPSVSELCFTPDGRLLMGVSDSEVKYLGDSTFATVRYSLFSIPIDGTPPAVMARGGGWVGSIAIAGERIVAACGDGTRVCNLDGSAAVVIPNGWYPYRSQISFSPEGSRFITGLGPVRLWSSDGRLERVISLPDDVFTYAAAFTPEGEIVIVHSRGFEVRGIHGELIRRHDGFQGWGRNSERIRTDGTRVFIPVSDDTTDVFDVKTLSMTVIDSDPGACVETGALSAWYAQHTGFGPFEGLLVLRGPRGSSAAIETLGMTAAAVSANGAMAWVAAPGRGVPVLHRLLPGGERPAGAALDGWPALPRAVRAAVAADGTVAVCSADLPDVRVVRPDGGQRDLRGGGAGLLAVAFSPDGKRVTAVGADDTVRTWNLSTGVSVACVADGGDWVAFTDDGFFDASAAGGRLLAMVRGTEVFGVEQMALLRNRPDILLSRLGTGSPDAVDLYFRRYVWRLVKAGLVPRSIPAADFQKGLLDASDAEGRGRLKACYEWKADSYRLRQDAGMEARIALFGVPAFLSRVEAGVAAGANPPAAAIASAAPGAGTLTLSCSFRSSGRALKSYNVYVDGVPVFPGAGEPLNGARALVTKTVALPPGPCRVEVSCTDAGMAESPRVGVDADGGPRDAGTLWYIGFGVSEYANPDLRLLFPGKDARDLRDALLAAKGGWRGVKAWAFTDGECTVEAVRNARGLLADARPGDTVVLFVAGHGLHDSDPDSTYYFLTHDADLSDLPRTAVSFSMIESILDGIAPTRKLFLMDTCESGEYDEMAMSAVSASGASHAVIRGIRVRGGRGIGRAAAPRVYVQETDRYIHRDLFQRTGAVVFSSSRAGEYSYEPDQYSPAENGFFTGAVLTALTTPAADVDGSGVLSAAELRAYVAAAVAERSDGCQHPTVDRDNPSSSVAFPLPEPGGAELSAADARTYLLAAAGNGSAAVVRLLLARAMKPARRDLDAALVAAAESERGNAAGIADCVRALLAGGADPNAVDASGISAAAAAYSAGRTEISVMLVEAGARVPASMVAESTMDESLRRAVQAAAARGVDRAFLQEAFWRSIQLGDPSAALLLLRAGADFLDSHGNRDAVIVAGEFGFPALQTALSRQRLLSEALISASASGNAGAIREALADGAFVNARVGRSPLIAASAAGMVPAAALLLSRGAVVDARDTFGATALVEAARGGHGDCVRLLLDAGADPNAATLWAETALSVAVAGGFRDVADLLRARGAR